LFRRICIHARYNDANARARNGVYQALFRGNGTTVAPAFRGLTFDGVVDTRTPGCQHQPAGVRSGELHLDRDQVQSATSPIALAKWQEAQLIIAEVQGERRR